MRGATKRRVRLFVPLLLAGTLVGVAYGGLINVVVGRSGLTGASWERSPAGRSRW